MNEWLSCTYTNTKSVQSRPGSKAILFSSRSSFFSLLYYYYSSHVRYDIVYQVRTAGLFSHHRRRWAMARERGREGEKDQSLYNHSYQKKFDIQCTRIFSHMPHFVNGQQRAGRTSFSVISSIGGKSNDTVHK